MKSEVREKNVIIGFGKHALHLFLLNPVPQHVFDIKEALRLQEK
jgi:hypothetical protein